MPMILGYRSTVADLRRQHARRPSGPANRPYPESLTPPKGRDCKQRPPQQKQKREEKRKAAGRGLGSCHACASKRTDKKEARKTTCDAPRDPRSREHTRVQKTTTTAEQRGSNLGYKWHARVLEECFGFFSEEDPA